MSDERLIEIVARAIREAPMRATLKGGDVIDPTVPLTPGELNRGRAALAAIRAAGFAIVATEGPEFDLHRFVVVSSDFNHPFMVGAYPTLDRAMRAQVGNPDKWLIYELTHGDDTNG